MLLMDEFTLSFNCTHWEVTLRHVLKGGVFLDLFGFFRLCPFLKVVKTLSLGSYRWTHRCHGIQRRWSQPLRPVWNPWNQLQWNIWQRCAEGNNALSSIPLLFCPLLTDTKWHSAYLREMLSLSKQMVEVVFLTAPQSLAVEIILSNSLHISTLEDNNSRLPERNLANCSHLGRYPLI